MSDEAKLETQTATPGVHLTVGAVRIEAHATFKWNVLPSLLVQTVITVRGNTSEGQLIDSVGIVWEEIARMLRENPKLMYEIDHRKWEEIIAANYDRQGFKVTLTSASGDLGRDVIAEREDWGCVRFIDQVKAYKPGHLVTANDVRALVGVLTADHNATKGFVTTTSDFAPKIKDDELLKPFMPYRLQLVNGTDLLKQFAKLETETKTSGIL